ncbi:hypothetical protein ABZ892_13210, partial [Streptomyces sp. NPDC046924]|uniref:hypothetical protein n=1 Tax=Streptomyces sp. NPDC046924 TaxID=3155136 RepID=UPI0033DE8374
STQVLLDRERCVLCARCTRFSNQIAGDPMIEIRGHPHLCSLLLPLPQDAREGGVDDCGVLCFCVLSSVGRA